MPGDTLVVADRHLAPQREAGAPLRGIPGAPGAGEVLSRTRVVHRRRAAGWGDHRLDAPHGRGDVEVHAVERGDRGVEQLLVPGPELVDALDHPAGIGLEVRDHLVDGRAGEDALGDLGHRVLDAVQLLPTPRVGLVEVELDAVEVARVQRVPLPPDRVGLGRVRRVLVDEVAAHRRVGRGGARRQLLEARHVSRRRRARTPRARRRARGRRVGSTRRVHPTRRPAPRTRRPDAVPRPPRGRCPRSARPGSTPAPGGRARAAR